MSKTAEEIAELKKTLNKHRDLLNKALSREVGIKAAISLHINGMAAIVEKLKEMGLTEEEITK